MTDKQIIDGVDVSGCCHQGKDNTCTCPHYKKECGRNPNCHYKIMQRQTKELDKFYKRELETKQKLFRKEQECEKLKEEVSLLKESNSKLQPIEDVSSLEKCYLQQLDQLKAENEDLLSVQYKLADNNKQLRQTLIEIKNVLDTYYDDDWKATREIEKIIEGKDNG